MEAPVDSVGAGSAVLGGGGGGIGASFLTRRESATKRSIRGKMLKLLPGASRKYNVNDDADVSNGSSTSAAAITSSSSRTSAIPITASSNPATDNLIDLRSDGSPLAADQPSEENGLRALNR